MGSGRINAVTNRKGAPAIIIDLIANQPAAATTPPGTIFISKDTHIIQVVIAAAWVTVGGTGSVTSVALSVPSDIFTSPVPGSPVTTAGTLQITEVTQAANTVWAGPTSGAAATPAFRALVAADIPSLSGSYYANGGNAFGASPSLIASATSAANFTISSTSNATKGKILWGASTAFNEAQKKLGIGTTTPESLSISGATFNSSCRVISCVADNALRVGALSFASSDQSQGFAFSDDGFGSFFIDNYAGNSNTVGFVFGVNVGSGTRTILGVYQPQGFCINSTSPYAALPPGFNGTGANGSCVIYTKTTGSNRDTGIMMHNSDDTKGFDHWADDTNGVAYVDNRYDNSGALWRVRMRTLGTPITALEINGTGDATFIGNVVINGNSGIVLKYTNSVAAPGTSAGPVFTNFYGGNTNALGDPVAWMLVNVAGTNRKIPLY